MGVYFGFTPMTDEGNRIQQWDKLNCDAVAQSQTVPQEILKLRWPFIFEKVEEREWDFIGYRPGQQSPTF